MSVNDPQFPGQVWDGTSPVRNNRLIDRKPEFEDWDQIVAELIASQLEIVVLGSAGGGASAAPVGGRLTYASGDPTPIADQIGKTILYYTPYISDELGLWDGSAFTLINFVETSVDISSNTDNFDIFGYLSSGVLALETLDWTNDTTRATALARQNGVLVKSGDVTRRYLGTGRAISSVADDSDEKRHLYNYYNKVKRRLLLTPAVNEHTYNSSTVRVMSGDANNNLSVVIGIADIIVNLHSYVATNKAAAVSPMVGIGINKTNDNDAVKIQNAVISTNITIGCVLMDTPNIGFHKYNWVQASVSTNNIVFTVGGTSGPGGYEGEVIL